MMLEQWLGVLVLLVVCLTVIVRASRGDLKQAIGIEDEKLPGWDSEERHWLRSRMERVM
jgi:hypothetical protein